MPFQKLRIFSDQIGTTLGTKVEIDGHEISGIRTIRLEGSHDDCWRCEIDFLPGQLDVEVETLVQRVEPTYCGMWRLDEADAQKPADPAALSLVLDIGKPPEGGA